MKNKLLLICAAFLLFSFLVLGTHFWYSFFMSTSGDFNNNNDGLKNGSIILNDNNSSVYDVDADSLEDDEVSSVTPYKFEIKNNSNKDGNYSIYIEDLPPNSVNDGCTEETLLERNMLKYQLKLNGNVIKEDYLSNINDNILDTRKIVSKESNYYELRFYIHDEATDWAGKHYHYKVVLNNK